MSEPSSQPDTSGPPVPLFVFGTARSGTSYLQELLNSHPRIRLSYEGCIVREGGYLYRRHHRLSERADFDKLLDELYRCEQEEPLNRWMLEVIRKHADELYRRHIEAPSFPKLIENIYMFPDPVSCWGNKMLRVEECPALLRLWPDAKVVILIRDPRAVYASQARFSNTRIRYSTIYWNLHSRWTRSQATDDRRYLVIRYEDFVKDAAAVLEQFLRMATVWDAQVARRMLEAHAPRSDSIHKWRESLTPDQIRTVERFCFDEMEHWGYSPELADRQQHLGVASKAMETVLEHVGSVRLDPRWWMRKRILGRFLRTLRG